LKPFAATSNASMSTASVEMHCNRDHAMINGFNPDLALSRTRTVMQCAPHCDFRFAKKRQLNPLARRRTLREFELDSCRNMSIVDDE
jgi:hypothetical protein